MLPWRRSALLNAAHASRIRTSPNPVPRGAPLGPPGTRRLSTHSRTWHFHGFPGYLSVCNACYFCCGLAPPGQLCPAGAGPGILETAVLLRPAPGGVTSPSPDPTVAVRINAEKVYLASRVIGKE